MVGNPGALADPLVIVSASPASGQANVPLQTTIIFEFNKELSPNTRDWNTAVVEPRQSAQITSAQLCVNADPCGGQGIPRYVRYVVQHAPNTDFTWLFFAARSIGGQFLEEPFVLRYTTGADIGMRTVAGQVAVEHSSSIPASVRAQLSAIVTRARNSEFGPANQDTSVLAAPDRRSEHHAGRVIDSPNTRVLLLNSFTVEEPDWLVRAATVLATGADEYSLTHVRDGVYWPLVVRFTDAGSTEIDAIGYLDDGTGQPAPLEVAGGSLQNLVLTLYAFPLRAAGEALAEAQAAAAAAAPDPEHLLISGGYGIRPEGTAYTWTYTFRSATLDKTLTVETHPLATMTTSAPLEGHFVSMITIPDVPIDSDAVLDIVMDLGGDEFLAGYPLRNIRTTVVAGHLFWVRPEPQPFWHVTLRTVTTSTTRTREWFIDMATGAPVSSEEDGGVRPVSHVLPSYPNPFATSTTIPIFLAEHSDVTFEVFDLSGRRVAVLVDGALPPGSHAIEWRPTGLASGLYLYRVVTGQTVSSGRVTLAR